VQCTDPGKRNVYPKGDSLFSPNGVWYRRHKKAFLHPEGNDSVKIVVVGGGEVGYSVAETLSEEGHDVTVVEENEERAARVDSELDVNAMLISSWPVQTTTR